MIVVDSSALMAIVIGEPERRHFLDLLDKAGGILISSATVIETRMVAHGRGGQAFLDKLNTVIRNYEFEIVPPGAGEIAAAQAAFITYGKGSGHPAQLNFGDLFSYALAKVRGLPLLFKGGDFAATDVLRAADQ